MKTETIAEFLARGGSVEQSTTELSLNELLETEGILSKEESDKVAKDLNEALTASINKQTQK